jgi:hypothetical protein
MEKNIQRHAPGASTPEEYHGILLNCLSSATTVPFTVYRLSNLICECCILHSSTRNVNVPEVTIEDTVLTTCIYLNSDFIARLCESSDFKAMDVSISQLLVFYVVMGN